jgi:hypothetical protein
MRRALGALTPWDTYLKATAALGLDNAERPPSTIEVEAALTANTADVIEEEDVEVSSRG